MWAEDPVYSKPISALNIAHSLSKQRLEHGQDIAIAQQCTVYVV